jgi:predicted nucleic acid-binding protein
MIVVDTNILAYLYLPGEFTEAAEALLESDPDWAAPVLWRSEFRNILAGYVRRGSLSFDQALAIQEEAESLLAGAEYEVDSRSVMTLVKDSDCSAYDCEFVALARGQAVGHLAGDDGWQAAAGVSADCAGARCCEMINIRACNLYIARVQIRSATLINGLSGQDALASELLDRQVKVARNEIRTSHPRRTIPNCHSS